VALMTDTTHTTALPLASGVWTLDAAHSDVGFAIRHLGISKVRGTFGEIEAELLVGDSLETSSLAATIHVASIDTGNPDRDAHVLSPDLLDVAQRPTLTFRSTRIDGAGDEWSVEGLVTVGSVTRPLTLDVSLGGIETYPIDGSRHAGFEATGEVSRKDLGIGFGALDAALGDKVRFEIDLQLVEPR
jgi:polyisoprenoid-binding protein YceI